MEIPLLLAVGAVLFLAWRFWPTEKAALPYRSRQALLSPAELRFYRALVSAVPSHVLVCCKVRLADLVTWPSNGWKEFGAPVSGKHIDFVLIDDSARILGCLELDDSSHNSRVARRKDAFKDNVLQAASIPLVRVKPARSYDTRVLRGALASLW